MEAKLKSNKDVTIIQVQGTLDIEDTQSFKTAILKNFSERKLVFNMQKASFVGSTGLGPFLETLKEFSALNAHGIKLVGVSIDFQRLFQNLELANLQIYESEDRAIQSFVAVLQ